MSYNPASPIEISEEDFKKIGYDLIDRIADFFNTIGQRPVTTGETAEQLKSLLGYIELPNKGHRAGEVIEKAADLLLNHSLLNGHPKFFGYITSSPAPIGALADLLAAAVNANVGAQILSPVATQIEKQTISWLAAMIGVSPQYGGILVSGGNMANFTAFLAARTAKAPGNIKEEGLARLEKELIIYCSATTHTWIEKAAILFGHGSKSIRWIATDQDNKMDIAALETTITNDLKNNYQPFIVVGTAGDVSTGVVDDLAAIAGICKKYDCWFHVDGAYGIPAVIVPELNTIFKGIEEADSIALDPHKWLFSPLEAGCTLVKDARHLTDTYSSHPSYYNFSGDNPSQVHNYYEYGFQNSRGFRAFKVWIMLQQVGRSGYVKLIRQNVELAKMFFELASEQPELQAISRQLSIVTLRYVPAVLPEHIQNHEAFLNELNEALLNSLQQGGELFLSNAIVKNKYCLRACIVNFRTTERDIKDTIGIIIREGRKMYIKLQSTPL